MNGADGLRRSTIGSAGMGFLEKGYGRLPELDGRAVACPQSAEADVPALERYSCFDPEPCREKGFDCGFAD